MGAVDDDFQFSEFGNILDGILHNVYPIDQGALGQGVDIGDFVVVHYHDVQFWQTGQGRNRRNLVIGAVNEHQRTGHGRDGGHFVAGKYKIGQLCQGRNLGNIRQLIFGKVQISDCDWQ